MFSCKERIPLDTFEKWADHGVYKQAWIQKSNGLMVLQINNSKTSIKIKNNNSPMINPVFLIL